MYHESEFLAALGRRKLSLAKAAKMCGMKVETFSRKVHTGKWFLSEMQHVAEVLGFTKAEFETIFFGKKYTDIVPA